MKTQEDKQGIPLALADGRNCQINNIMKEVNK